MLDTLVVLLFSYNMQTRMEQQHFWRTKLLRLPKKSEIYIDDVRITVGSVREYTTHTIVKYRMISPSWQATLEERQASRKYTTSLINITGDENEIRAWIRVQSQ